MFGRVRFQEHTHTDTLTHEDTPLLGAKERVEEGGERETHCDRVKKTKTTREGCGKVSCCLFAWWLRAQSQKAQKAKNNNKKKNSRSHFVLIQHFLVVQQILLWLVLFTK